jgi:uncharacterized protein (TIGR03437 family)
MLYRASGCQGTKKVMRQGRKSTKVCKRRLDRKVFVYFTVFFLAVLCQAQGPPTYYIQTVVGTGGSPGFSGDGGPATSAQLNNPTSVAVDGAGTIYIADQVNNAIREVAKSNGLISTQAGTPTTAGYTGDTGLATSAELNEPLGVVVDTSGNFYIADSLNNVIRKVTPTDTITTFAGDNALGANFSGDGGIATSAVFDVPSAVALDSAGNLYIVDTENNRVRKVTASTNIITTIAGNGQLGYLGDGKLGTVAELYHPLGVAVDSAGNVYIADSGNHVIRKLTPSGSTYIITTVAGTGDTPGFGGDGGPATSALLNNPRGVAVDAAGNLYIADTFNGKIREVINGTIYTIAGNGRLNAFTGDGGLAKNAALSFPYGVTVDKQGNVYVADTQNHVIRELTGSLISIVPPPVITPGGVISASQFGGFPSTTPGSWIEIYGGNLAADSRSWALSDFTGNIAPTSLDKTSVSVGGEAAYIAYIGYGQVNALVPSNVVPGPQYITVTTPGGTTPGYPITVNPNQPEVWAPPAFYVNGNQYVAALFSDNVTYVAPPGLIPGHTTRQAKPGEIITIYGIGFGPVSPAIPAGEIVPGQNQITSTLLMLFGNTPANTTYAGLAPGLVGLYQINVVVPNIPNSDLVPLSFTLGGAANSQILYTAVHN